MGINILEIPPKHLFHGTIGTAEKNLVRMFQRAKALAPCIIFIDEIDSIFFEDSQSVRDGSSDSISSSTHLANTFIDCLEDISMWNRAMNRESYVVIIAASRRPWNIDKMLLRPGRIDQVILLEALNYADRKSCLSHQIQRILEALNLGSKDLAKNGLEEYQYLLRKVINETDGFTVADMRLLCQRLAIYHKNCAKSNRTIPVSNVANQTSEISKTISPTLAPDYRILHEAVTQMINSIKLCSRNTSLTTTENYWKWMRDHNIS